MTFFGLNKLSANQVADMILLAAKQKGLDGLTARNLQKLLYFSYLYHLEAKGKPLFAEQIKAWEDGPVVPTVWHRFKENRPAKCLISVADINLEKTIEMVKKHQSQMEMVLEVVSLYGNRDEEENVAITHGHEPWIRARNSIPEDTQDTNNSPAIDIEEMKTLSSIFVNVSKQFKTNAPKVDMRAREAAFHDPTVSVEEGKAMLRMLDAPPPAALVQLMSRPKRWV